MNTISEYARNIAIFLIFIAFIGIVIPNEKYKKYINLICGFVLMILVLTPVLKLFSNSEININNIYKEMEINLNRNIIHKELEYYEEATLNMILETYKSDLENQMKIIILSKGFNPLEINIEIDVSPENFGEVTQIKTIVSKEAVKNNKNSVINIERISIGPQISSKNIDDRDFEESIEIKNLKNYLSDFYNLSVSNIYIKEQ